MDYRGYKICDSFTEMTQMIQAGIKFDLILTDPPYNVNAKVPKKEKNGETFQRQDAVAYNDSWASTEEYREWSRNWFELARKIAKRIIFTPGRVNLGWWLFNYEDKGMKHHPWIQKNASSRGDISVYCNDEPILFFGGFGHVYPVSFFDIPITSGFLRERPAVHPHPKPLELYLTLLEPCITKLGVKSVYDPFGGSGTTLLAARSFGIEHYITERSKDYEQDILYCTKCWVKAKETTQPGNLMNFLHEQKEKKG